MFAIFKNDPIAKMISGKSTRRRKKRKSSKGKLTVSERRIVNAVSRRVNTRKKKR